MINKLFSPESRKAWVGTATTILSPLFVLITSTDQEITWRVVIAAVVSGLIGGASVFGTKNAKPQQAVALRPSERGRHEAGEEDSSPGGN